MNSSDSRQLTTPAPSPHDYVGTPALATPAQVIVDVLGAPEPQLCDPAEPMIFADDLAAVRGDGVFETLMLRNGEVHNLQRHATRFVTSAAMLDLGEPDLDRWLAATELAAEAFGASVGAPEAALRWVYSRGRESTGQATGWVTVAPIAADVLTARQSGVKVMTAERGFRIDLSERSPWALIGAKTLSYAANMAALRYAKAHGLQDVIFVSDEGHVLEGPTSSVVVLRDNTLVTPPIEAGVLPGTTQAALFRVAEEQGWETAYEVLSVQDLIESDGVWLVSSVRVQARVTELDGHEMPRAECADEIEQMMWEAVAH
ncbi:aminodeoxychorismate lyase [Corynebacterium anserum]|uniref:Aminodeoxychorismate lyase n=1 Tax=Corynebacterium anserum TaxID=2684406 RepID=A0A7G7YM66_9CORY|nr:aminodeoxychorismate lyase [Corynebacterium anserum]QNH95586.1 aminodeoxychorismate lyase [Corynebacterium anserum]